MTEEYDDEEKSSRQKTKQASQKDAGVDYSKEKQKILEKHDETDEGWDNGYKKDEPGGIHSPDDNKADPNRSSRARGPDGEEPEEVDDQQLPKPDVKGPTEGAETTDERAIQLLSAVETACRDLQAHWFAHEEPAEAARCPTLLHRLIWLSALENCGCDAWDLAWWEQAPDSVDSKERNWSLILGPTDLDVPGD